MLTKDEEVHMDRCLTSLAWCEQVLVVDSGSTDRTVALAHQLGADVIETSWRGYGGQRDWAINLDVIRHDWVYFVDADEWVSNALAREIEFAVREPGAIVACEQRFRLVWQDTWIKHCGWYGQNWITRLMRRSSATFDPAQPFTGRALIAGESARLKHDLVDENVKGLATWIAKHAGYAAQTATERRMSWRDRLAQLTNTRSTVPLLRRLLKFGVFPTLPFKPFALWVFMFALRGGFRHGRVGFQFCTLHACHQYHINVLSAPAHTEGQRYGGMCRMLPQALRGATA